MFDVVITGHNGVMRVRSNTTVTHWQAASVALRVAGTDLSEGEILVTDGITCEGFEFVTIDGMSAVL